MEDILEEIVGDILDEYDEDDSTFRTQKDNSVIIDALAYLEDVAEELGIDFGKVEFETLNGYLTNLLGHIPTEDDLDKEIVVNGYRFRILSLGNKTIGKVRAEKIKKNQKERIRNVGTFKIRKHKAQERKNDAKKEKSLPSSVVRS